MRKAEKAELDRAIAESKKSDSSGEAFFKDVMENHRDFVESNLQCSICSELFIGATVLGCGHTFCAFCLDEWSRSRRRRGKNPLCAVCRAEVKQKAAVMAMDDYIEKSIESFFSEEAKKTRADLVKDRKAKMEERAQEPVRLLRESSDSSDDSDDESDRGDGGGVARFGRIVFRLDLGSNEDDDEDDDDEGDEDDDDDDSSSSDDRTYSSRLSTLPDSPESPVDLNIGEDDPEDDEAAEDRFFDWNSDNFDDSIREELMNDLNGVRSSSGSEDEFYEHRFGQDSSSQSSSSEDSSSASSESSESSESSQDSDDD